MSETEAADERETIRFDNVRLEIEGPLATIWLDDPNRLNALSAQMVEALFGALIEIAKPRRKIRCVMVTGEGRGFCAGANLAAVGEKGNAGDQRAEPPALAALEGAFHPLIRRFRDIGIPVVAAVNGPCVGIGLALALLSDHIVASDKAYFLVPFVSLASSTDSGLTWLLPRAIGPARARTMVMQAKRVSAETALEWGMIHEVVPMEGFRDAARAVALDYANGPTVALGVMRQLFQRGADRSLDEQLEAELKGVMKTARTKDNLSAIMAFGKKAKPSFNGE